MKILQVTSKPTCPNNKIKSQHHIAKFPNYSPVLQQQYVNHRQVVSQLEL